MSQDREKPQKRVEAAEDFLARYLAQPEKPKPEVLLSELDAVLRSKPGPRDIYENSDEAIAWIGRATAALRHWNDLRVGVPLILIEGDLHSGRLPEIGRGFRGLAALLHEAINSIRMATSGPLNIAVAPGMIFDYFDEVRKIIERATSDLLFVDPYLDAEFVSRYLVFVSAGVPIRLLGRHKLSTLLPAVDVFAAQRDERISVRSTDKIHDRYVFVDQKDCYQSGASFKDGAKTAGTTLTQITDAFEAMQKHYESIWEGAKSER